MSVDLFYFVLLMLSIYALSSVGNETTPECHSWQQISKYLQETVNRGNCVANSECTGLSCSSKYKENNVEASIKLNACDSPISLEITVNIPTLGINNTTYKFIDGQRYQLPERVSPSNISVEVSLKQHEQKVTMSVAFKSVSIDHEWALIKDQNISIPPCQKEKPLTTKAPQMNTEEIATVLPLLTQKTIVAALTLKTCSADKNCNASEVCINELCVCKAGTVQESGNCIPVHQSNKNTDRPCDKSSLRECSDFEMCAEVDRLSTTGTCVCLDKYHLDVNRQCIADDGQITPEGKEFHSVTVTLAIAIPVLVLMACAGVAFAVYKLKLVHRFQVYRRGVRSYEVVEIGNNDEDDDEPLII